MSSTFPCPSPDLLQRLVNGEATPQLVDLFAKHLERCFPCTQRLEQLSGYKTLQLEVRRGGLATNALGTHDLEALRRKDVPISDDAAAAASTRMLRPHDTLGEEPAQPPGAASALPAAVPGFEIVGELGRGGMGVVYKARQLSLNRLVALKMVLAGEYASSEDLVRFLNEAEAVARLKHPNIVQVYDVGRHLDRPYFTMEFVDGGSLAQKIAGSLMPIVEVVSVVQALGRAMHEAHQQGIVHRDLKPGNVLLAADGTPKITDFGLAKRLEGGPGLTQSGAIMGTPSYMAPEQARGDTKEIGPAADIYALGAVLYELVTGRPPFKAATPLDTVLQVISEDPVPPSRLQPGLPGDLETICLKCLHKEPAKRYASARELADDLGRFAAGEPILARPVGKLERAVKWVKRRPMVAALLALLMVVTVAGFAAVLWQLQETESALHTADANARAFESATREAKDNAQNYKTASEQAEANARAATRAAGRADDAAKKALKAADAARTAREHEKRHLYVAHMNLVQRAWERADIPVVLDLLKRHIPKAGEPDNREWEWYYYWGLVHSDLYTLRDLPGPVRSIAFAPSKWSLKQPTKMLLAIACENGSVLLWDAAARTPPRTLRNEKILVRCLAFSPDGKTLAWATGAIGKPGVITLWDMATDKAREVIKGHKYPVSALAFSPDGKILAAAAVQFPQSVQGDLQAQRSMAVSLDMPGEVKLWDTSNGQELPPLKGATDSVLSLAFLPSTGTLVAGKANTGIAHWRLTTRQLILDTGARNSIWSLAVHPWDESYEQYVASGAVDMDHGESSLLIVRGSQVFGAGALAGHRLGVLASTFSPDGRIVATTGYDKTIKLFDSLTRQELGSFRGHSDGLQALAFSPDGRTLASGSWDRTVKLWDMTTPQEWVTLDEDDATEFSIRVSSDGSLVSSYSSRDKTTKLWDLKTRTVLGQHSGYLHAEADGKVVGVRLEKDELVLSLSEVSGKASKPFARVKTGEVSDWAISADLQWLITTQQKNRYLDNLKIWNISTAQEHVVLMLPNSPGNVRFMGFSPDGKKVAASMWGGRHPYLQIWDVASGKPCGKPRTLDGGTCLNFAFSPDGKLLAAPCDDHTVRLFDTADGKEVHVFRGHNSNVLGAAFSPDGRTLVSSGWDRQIKLWDVNTKEERLSLPGVRYGAWGLGFSADGKSLVAEDAFRVLLWRAAQHTDDVLPPASLPSSVWHRQQAERAVQRKQMRSARFHLAPLLEAHPEDQQLRVLARAANLDGSEKLTLRFKKEDKLSPDDAKDKVLSSSFHKAYSVKMDANRDYVIDLVSSDFDTFLRLADDAGKQLADSDDGGDGLNARIAFTPPKTGIYRIIATSFKPATGAFALTVHEREATKLSSEKTGNKALAADEVTVGMALYEKKDMDGAIRHLRNAVALDASSFEAHANLGVALSAKNELDEAIVHFKRAIDLDPTSPTTHTNLAGALHRKQDLDGAIVALKKALDLEPRDTRALTDLGDVYVDKKDLDAGIACYERAIQIDPADARTYSQLGAAFFKKKDMDKALLNAKKAVEINPRLAEPHNNLGVALLEKDDVEGALAHLRQGIKLGLRSRDAFSSYAMALLKNGDFEEAKKAADELVPLARDEPDRRFAKEFIAMVDELIATDEVMAVFLAGKMTRIDRPEPHLDILKFCKQYRRHLASISRFYEGAFKADPKSGEDVLGGLRYEVACCAALAGAGLGRDAQKLPEGERGKLRQNAHDWLRADLRLYATGVSPSGKLELRLAAAQNLPKWQRDSSLAGLRDEQHLARLPAADRQAWLSLWRDVADLSRQAMERCPATTFKFALTDQQLERPHDVKMQVGRIYVITLDSKRFDALLRVEDTTKRILAENDDIGPKKRDSRVIFAPAVNGVYRVVATSFRGAGRGEGTLSIHEVTPKSASDHKFMGDLFYKNKERGQAIAQFKKAIELDPKLVGAHGNLGMALNDQKDFSGAIGHLAKAVALGSAEMQVYDTLATLYQNQGKHVLAEPLYKETVAMARRQSGADSTDYAGQLALYGLNLVYQKKYTEAETPLREALAIREKKQPGSWTTFNTRSVLGGALLGQKKHAEAEPLLVKGYEGLTQREAAISLEVRSLRLIEALERLVRLYEATGNAAEALKWRKELDLRQAK